MGNAVLITRDSRDANNFFLLRSCTNELVAFVIKNNTLFYHLKKLYDTYKNMKLDSF